MDDTLEWVYFVFNIELHFDDDDGGYAHLVKSIRLWSKEVVVSITLDHQNVRDASLLSIAEFVCDVQEIMIAFYRNIYYC